MRIIFPDGHELDYPSATYLNQGETLYNLYTAHPDEGGRWIASISVTAPVVIEAASGERSTPLGMLRYIAAHVDEFRQPASFFYLRQLKWSLKDFSARYGWKDKAEEGDESDEEPPAQE